MAFINCTATWADQSSGVKDETGQELQIYTDSPSFVPTIPVDLTVAPHPWMSLLPIAAGETEASFQLQTPVTFVTLRVRQYNADGVGPWTTPAGTTFTITPTAGVNVPDAPSNPGFVITEGGVVAPPPPPPPPVDPPPTPPPTGGGTGSTSNYVFTTQFSGTQGLNQWSYKDSADVDMTYSVAGVLWNGSEAYMGIWSSGLHPGSTKGAKVRWTAPAAGTALLSGTTQLFSRTGNNGVTLTINHNGSLVHAESMTDTTVRTLSESVVMAQGDTLDFILTAISGITNASTSFLPSIQFTTDGTTPANPVLSNVSPSSMSITTGGVSPLTVTLSSAPGAPAAVTLVSSDPTKATVPASVTVPAGQLSASVSVTAVAAGSSNVTATYNSTDKVCAVTVSNPASGEWGNAPAGGVVLLNHSFSTVLTTGMSGGLGNGGVTTDASAPLSPPNVIVSRLNVGTNSGGGQIDFWSTSSYRELYCGLWWRTNPQWTGRVTQDKMFFLRGSSGTNGYFGLINGIQKGGANSVPVFFWAHNSGNVDNSHIMSGPQGGQAYPNVGSSLVPVGVWHKLEARIKCSTTLTSRDGEVQWWVDNVLCGNYTQVNYGTAAIGLSNWTWSETWDGSGNPVHTVPQEHYVDHVYVVGKN